MTAAAKANPNIKISYVPSNSSNDYTPNLNAEVAKEVRHDHRRRRPDGRQREGGGDRQPDRALRRGRHASRGAEHVRHAVQHRAGRLPRWLPGRRHDQDRQGRHLRRRRHPAGDDLHGRLLGGRAVLQPAVKGKNVQVLGWDENNQKGGTFVPGSNPFGDQNGGQQISQTFIHQGADVIFPVAGGSGLGAGAAAEASGGKVKVIWVDTDGCQSAAQYCKYFLSSVTKGLASAVQTYLKAGRHAARSRPATTSGRCRTAAPAWRRTTRPSRRRCRPRSPRSRPTSSRARSRSRRRASPPASRSKHPSSAGEMSDRLSLAECFCSAADREART